MSGSNQSKCGFYTTWDYKCELAKEHKDISSRLEDIIFAVYDVTYERQIRPSVPGCFAYRKATSAMRISNAVEGGELQVANFGAGPTWLVAISEVNSIGCGCGEKHYLTHKAGIWEFERHVVEILDELLYKFQIFSTILCTWQTDRKLTKLAESLRMEGKIEKDYALRYCHCSRQSMDYLLSAKLGNKSRKKDNMRCLIGMRDRIDKCIIGSGMKSYLMERRKSVKICLDNMIESILKDLKDEDEDEEENEERKGEREGRFIRID